MGPAACKNPPVPHYAAVDLQPPGIIGWLLVGLIAGAIAGRIVRGRGYGCVVDIVVGILGAFIGGFLLSLVVPTSQTYGFIGSLLVATLGAVVLLAVIRLFSQARG